MSAPAALGREIGRYRLFDEIAAGGMATVHVGRLLGPAGFSRTVAIKRLHSQFAKDLEFRAMFLDEARLAARIRHPNVVSTLDVVSMDDELFLVMEYVQGEALSRLMRIVAGARERIPPRVASKIVIDTLLGLHAAHEATSDRGEPLGIVHRDVSPQNILVGSDGVARVVDFGVAKAAARLQTTQDGQLKGKLAYMAPEQLQDRLADRRTDVFATGIVLWEILTGQRLFSGNEPAASIAKILSVAPETPSRRAPGLPPALDAVALRALAKLPDERFATAREMAIALESAMPPAGPLEVGEWLERVAGDTLSQRAKRVRDVESVSSSLDAVGAQRIGSPGIAPAETEGSARSGLTNLSAARAVSRPPPPRRALPVALGAVAGLLLFGGVLVWWIGTRSGPSAEPATLEPPVVAASPEPRATPAAVAAPEVASSAPSPPASAVPSASAPAKRPVVPKLAAPKPRESCDPPYYLDAKGAKRFKPHCF